MDENELHKLEELFYLLVDIPPGPEREAAALQHSGQDAKLAGRALQLVASDEMANAANDAAHRAAMQPRAYGNYRTIRPLGVGGMGAVYLAERVDGQFEQTVASKVIAPHIAGDAFRERFLAERQILAGLNHPNITRLLDGGVTSDGTPYMVMEYVDGEPLDRYCDHHKLNLRQRLGLFLKVCAAVSSAHRSLVVHRDLKPSNILVTAEGEPMLLDFGTAKLLATGATADTVLPMATPRYTSPEQWSHAPITTSSDIFSLGVVLYELLTGCWPFGDPGSTRQIFERFSRGTPMTSPQTVVTEEAARARTVTPRALKGSLAGDLSNILAKALDPSPAQRYESVPALAADIENWLGGLPVAAKARRFSYRAAKFLRRHWLPSVAAAVFILGLLASTLYAVHQANRARTEAMKAEKVNQFLNGMLSSAGALNFDPQTFTVSAMLDAAARQLDANSQDADAKDEPVVEAALRQSLGQSYIAVQKYNLARTHLQKARAIFHRLGRTADEVETLRFLAVNEGEAGNPQVCVRYYRETLSLLKTAGTQVAPLVVFSTKQALADELSAVMNQDLEEADRLFREAIALAEQEPSIPRWALAQAITERGGMLLNQGKSSEAEAAFYQAIALYQKEKFNGAAKSHPYYELAMLNARRDNFVAAKDFARQNYEITLATIGPHHARTASNLVMWARFRAETGETNEAVEQARRALLDVRQGLPSQSMSLWMPLISASHVLNLGGCFAEATPIAREVLSLVDHHKLPELDARRANSLVELATALHGEKQDREALADFERAARIYEQLGPVWAKRAGQVRKTLREVPKSSASR